MKIKTPLRSCVTVLAACLYPVLLSAQSSLLEKLIGSNEPNAKSVYDSGPREQLVSGRYIPVPYLYFGPSLMPDGYRVGALTAEGGLSMDAKHILFNAHAAFDDGHKDDDGTGPNPKGHDRYLGTEVYFRPGISGWSEPLFFGGGYDWNELSTSNYTKKGSRWQPGGGYDWFHRRCAECYRSISARFEVNWILAGKDWQNGSHGPVFDVTIPSPREKRHLFFHGSSSVLRYHDTVTDPNNPPLVQAELSNRHFTGSSDMGVLYRF